MVPTVEVFGSLPFVVYTDRSGEWWWRADEVGRLAGIVDMEAKVGRLDEDKMVFDDEVLVNLVGLLVIVGAGNPFRSFVLETVLPGLRSRAS